MFSLIFAWMDGWVNNREAGDLRRHRAHYDVNVMNGGRLWRYDLETRFALLGHCQGNSQWRPPHKGPVFIFYVSLNTLLHKQSSWQRFETLMWRHWNGHISYGIFSIGSSAPEGLSHDDVIKWKHFPRNWPFVRGIDRSRLIPHTKASVADLWYFLWSASE